MEGVKISTLTVGEVTEKIQVFLRLMGPLFDTSWHCVVVISRRFWRKMPDSYKGSFLDAYGPLFSSFVQLELQMSKTNRRPELRKHTKDAPFGYLDYFDVFNLDFFFSTMTLFWKCVPSVFWYFATEWMVKKAKGSPFYIFRHCDTVQNSQFSFFFRKFFKVSKGSFKLGSFLLLCNF